MMKLYSLVIVLALGFTLAAADANNNNNNNNKYCDLWSAKDYEYDLVAVTDDTNYGEGRAEDMALVRAFRKLGRKATRISIQDDDFDWTSTKMVVIRSAWNKYDYIEDYVAFQAKMNDMAILMNPLKIIQWQANKEVYLSQLKEAGIHMIETVIITKDDVMHKEREEWSIECIQEKLGCEKLILKPAFGNSGANVALYPDEEEDFMENFVDIVWHNREAALFQCFQEQILTKGERGIVFVGGEVSHGIMKQAGEESYILNTGFGATWSIYDPTPEEADFAKNVAAKVAEIVGETPAYLRVDVFNDNDDNLALMELAAGTADLWISRKPEAADYFAAYLDKYLREVEAECAVVDKDSEEAEASKESKVEEATES